VLVGLVEGVGVAGAGVGVRDGKRVGAGEGGSGVEVSEGKPGVIVGRIDGVAGCPQETSSKRMNITRKQRRMDIL
jgi:hypothetical protein